MTTPAPRSTIFPYTTLFRSTGDQRNPGREGEENMPERYVNVDRETAMLLPPDLRQWVSGDDLVHFVILAVESADLSTARVDRKSTRLNSSHLGISYAVFCLK